MGRRREENGERRKGREIEENRERERRETVRSNTETTPDFEPRMDLTTSLSVLLSLLFSFLLSLSSSLSFFLRIHAAKELSQRVLFTLDSCGRSSIERSRRKPPSAIPSAEFCDPCRLPVRTPFVHRCIRCRSVARGRVPVAFVTGSTFGSSRSFSRRTIGIILQFSSRKVNTSADVRVFAFKPQNEIRLFQFRDINTSWNLTVPTLYVRKYYFLYN